MLVRQDLSCFFIIVLRSDKFHDKNNKSDFFFWGGGIFYSYIRDFHCIFTGARSFLMHVYNVRATIDKIIYEN